ncbi:uncharacterized protein LOC116182800 [Photinus pyralis]|uniref:uncharacterized protein LOC116182800 n=1 Tax=Photinus pyralis TaxID=7054 RepID=UPI0012670D14|nr:uncharacterized protein LOC116182800 [Photinus pyralis]
MAELQNPLPPGWDCQCDRKSGRYYYVNHLTKTTTWDDPRLQHKPRHPAPIVPVEHIVMQHGSPEFRRNYVYPSQTTPIPAFQIPPHCSPKFNALRDLSHVTRGSPRTSRLQDTTLSAAANTEEAVTKISTMFPTVSDTHIRLLLKKYHNREALVISALQVEKHPITTPGPFTTPPPVRNIQTNNYAHLQMTPPLGLRFCSRGGSPILRSGSGGSNETYRNSPKPHSPKLKLRYMKFIFPKAEETMILDILSGNDNNIQKASEILIEMGFEKRDNAKKQSVLSKPEPAKVQHAEPDVVPAIKSVAEKKISKLKKAKVMLLNTFCRFSLFRFNLKSIMVRPLREYTIDF